MAKPPEAPSPEDAFIREVDEEYRKDQLNSFWSRYGRWLLIVVGLGLIALAVFLWWREEEARKAGELSETYSEAIKGLDLGKPEASQELDRLAAGEFGGYSVLARFKKAALAIENGDNAGALASYASLAADQAVPPALQTLAKLKAIRLKFDETEAPQLIEELRPIAVPGSAWFGIAGEMLAAAYIRDGKPDLAGPIYSEIARDESLAPGLRQRSSQLAASLGVSPDAPADEAENDAGDNEADENAADDAAEAAEAATGPAAETEAETN